MKVGHSKEQKEEKEKRAGRGLVNKGRKETAAKTPGWAVRTGAAVSALILCS